VQPKVLELCRTSECFFSGYIAVKYPESQFTKIYGGGGGGNLLFFSIKKIKKRVFYNEGELQVENLDAVELLTNQIQRVRSLVYCVNAAEIVFGGKGSCCVSGSTVYWGLLFFYVHYGLCSFSLPSKNFPFCN
jgi:mevalonate kinase